MKIKLLLFFLFVFCSGFSFSQNPLVKQWDKRFGGRDDDQLYSLQQTFDGGYILGGFSYSGVGGDKTQASQGKYDYWIVKTDSLGNYEWDKRFGGTDDDLLYSLQQTRDGGYILAGLSPSGIGGDKTQASQGGDDYWIVKTDYLGSYQWDKRFGGTGYDYLNIVRQTRDNGYILGGLSTSGIGGNKTQASRGSDDYWIVKTDSLGNYQWDKRFGGTSIDDLYCLEQTRDGGYILGGVSGSGLNGDKSQVSRGGDDYWIVKIDSFGNYQWDKRYGGSSVDQLYSLKQTRDGGYILGGWSGSGIGGDKTQASQGIADYWIVKIDSVGNKQWDKDLGGNDTEDDIGNVSLTSDGGYLMAGTSYSPLSGDKTENNLGTEQSWIIKIDSLGNKQWDKTLLTPNHDERGNAIQTKEGCYVFANYTDIFEGGEKTQYGQGGSDYWIIKFCDTTQQIIENIPSLISDNSSGMSIYPNPVSQSITVSWPPLVGGNTEIVVVNVIGEKVYTAQIEEGNKKQETINCKQFAPGIYFVKIANQKMNWVGKLVKE